MREGGVDGLLAILWLLGTPSCTRTEYCAKARCLLLFAVSFQNFPLEEISIDIGYIRESSLMAEQWCKIVASMAT